MGWHNDTGHFHTQLAGGLQALAKTRERRMAPSFSRMLAQADYPWDEPCTRFSDPEKEIGRTLLSHGRPGSGSGLEAPASYKLMGDATGSQGTVAGLQLLVL
ncbi:hypothetical protein [Pontibacter sp. SGAir0037]|uniref:hypothetical protein n=1 Tax=Pontibacter sp. SGAir0037 TaxID=2571030 RepID=UPI0010CCE3C8|nr:hypothetical protein [Pontibacter sp. SGAir0037]QCR24660.1 hypothetical protein C1N53_21415 [Pontibacter sp. SGAir0037]